MNENTNSTNLPTPNTHDLTAALETALTVFSDYADTLEDKSSSALESMADAYKQFRESLTELFKMKDIISKFVNNMKDMTDDLIATVDDFDETDDILVEAMKDSGLIEDEEDGDKEEEEEE